jgi:hypothetical protein
MTIHVPMWLVYYAALIVGVPVGIWLLWRFDDIYLWFSDHENAKRRERERAEFTDSMTRNMTQEQRSEWVRDFDRRRSQPY